MRFNGHPAYLGLGKIILAACAAFSLQGCAHAGAAQNTPVRANAWTTPHVLTMSDASGSAGFTTLNPHLSGFAPTANLSEMTMAWLLKWDEHNQLYPELATAVPSKTNGGVSKDGLTITYHLRKGVKWSDGAAFDADDVVFSTSVVNNPANTSEPARFDMVARVSEPDKFTVVFHLKKPFSLALETFFSSCCANPPLLPKHLLAKYPNINNAPYNSLPVGIAPFKFQRWDRSKEVVMVADPLYWRGRPKLDKIVFKIIPNREALLLQLRAHKIDLWYQFSGAYVPRIRALSGYTVHPQPGYVYTHYDFNLTRPALSDVRVRRALRLAFNRRELIAKVEQGLGVVQDSPTPANAPYFVNLGTTRYDPKAANALLDSAGWMRGADGIRAKNGVKLDLNVAARAAFPDLDKQLEILRKNWMQVGVAINVHHYTPERMFENGANFKLKDWDVVSFGWANDPMGDYTPFYDCTAFSPAGRNDEHWCNKKAQSAMHALLAHYGQAERTADLKVAMREFDTDVPSIVAFMRVDLFAFNKDLQNYHPNTLTWFDNMMDVDI